MYNRNEIALQLDEKVSAFVNYIKTLSQDEFEATPNEKWSAGQNLDHMVKAIEPLQLPFQLPKFMLKLMFGKANRPSKTYDELVVKYKRKLAEGGKASGRFIPPVIAFENKDTLIQTYLLQKEKLIKKIRKQNETALDTYILPHPLLGKLTLREMLYFTIYHNQHHLELLKNRD
ncbi:MAG TPA: DinB family protein [Chitinophagaceae bacterium]